MKISVGAVLVLAASLLAVVVASCGSDTADPSVAAPASATPTSAAALTPTPASAAALTPTPTTAETPTPTPLPIDSTTPTRGSTQPPTPASTESNAPSPTSTLPPTALSPAGNTPAQPLLGPLTVARAFEHLDFRGLTNLTQPAAGDDRLFVTEQSGRVLAFANDEAAREAQVFLDIQDRVSDRGSEEGLLGLAFDPAYHENGYFYVYYSASGPRRSVVSRFHANAERQQADPASELVIMEIDQPFSNHNGGQLAFGLDGFLYVGLGDGGSGGDPMRHGRNKGTLLGSILRIDVSRATSEAPYATPPDNPFIDDAGARGEIWAYGLRNPWRFSFDRETGRLWAGDVGQNSVEEVDVVEKGGDYGWNRLEGSQCFSAADCDPTGTVLPVWEYPTRGNCSVIGGYVYRGGGIPSLTGAYVFADFCSGRIWALRYDGQEVTEHLLLADTPLQIVSFGQDRDGGLYVLSQNSGIYRLIP